MIKAYTIVVYLLYCRYEKVFEQRTRRISLFGKGIKVSKASTSYRFSRIRAGQT